MAWTDSTVAVRKRHMDDADVMFAFAKRQAGAPSSAIARMMGVCREDLDKLFGPQPSRAAPVLMSEPRVPAAVVAPPRPAPAKPKLIDIVARRIAIEHDVTVSEMCGQSRLRRFVWARQHLMWALHQERDANGRRRFSTPQIGAFLGGRDHSTVVYGMAKYEERATSTGNVRWDLFNPIAHREIVENQSGEAVFDHQPHPSKIQTVEV